MSSSPRSSNSSKISRLRLPAIAALVALAPGCSPVDEWRENERFAMGTAVVSVHRSDPETDERALQVQVDSLLAREGSDYYAWGNGELARLNTALAAGESFSASPELVALLEHAGSLSRRSGGRFDPGVGAMVEAWGFHDARNEPSQPPAQLLAAWTEMPRSIADLAIDGDRIGSEHPLVIDLGGIAKGAIVDRVLEVFARAGVEDVLVDAGGDVRVLGRRGDRAWTIGIQAPRAATDLIGSIELRSGEAAFTSGDYERYFDTAAGRSHHLLDPRSGLPATHTQAVTVLAENGALADAAATALFVAGPEDWRAVAMALGISHVLRVGADGVIEMTDAMRERVRMQAGAEPATMSTGP